MAVPTTSDCAPVPEVDDTVIQLELGVAVQLPRVPPPEFERMTDCMVGLLDPEIALKKRLSGAMATPGVDCDTSVSETFTVCCAGVAPGAFMLTVPE